MNGCILVGYLTSCVIVVDPNRKILSDNVLSAFDFGNRQMRSGYGRSIFGPLLPLILGRDVSGEVAAVGAYVQSFSIGQEVFGALHPTAVRGTYSDFAILSEDELTKKPPSLTHVVMFSSFNLILCNDHEYIGRYEIYFSTVDLCMP